MLVDRRPPVRDRRLFDEVDGPGVLLSRGRAALVVAATNRLALCSRSPASRRRLRRPLHGLGVPCVGRRRLADAVRNRSPGGRTAIRPEGERQTVPVRRESCLPSGRAGCEPAVGNPGPVYAAAELHEED